MIAAPIRTVPASRTACNHPIATPSAFTPIAGTPAIKQITTAIKGNASNVGIFFVIINATIITKAKIIKIP